MGAQLNIKSADAYRLASLVSELDRERRERNIEAKVARMAAGKAIRAVMKEPITSHRRCLCDQNGFSR